MKSIETFDGIFFEQVDDGLITLHTKGREISASGAVFDGELEARLRAEADKYFCIELGGEYLKSPYDEKSYHFKKMRKRNASKSGIFIENNSVVGFVDVDRLADKYLFIPVGGYEYVLRHFEFTSAEYFLTREIFHCITTREDFSRAILDVAAQIDLSWADEKEVEEYFSVGFDDLPEF